ncbi:MAG: fructosamine kinase family protein [Clostridiales bacterium]|jgi:fructosamine-3-kinase|nr:fructosamine kinase family protein [Clostridiales bacterium]
MEKILFDKEKLTPAVKALGQYERGEKIKSVIPLGGGGFGLTYRLAYADGTTEIIKVFKTSGMLQSESEALRLLRQASPLKVPEVYYTREADEKFPLDAMAMEHIDGICAKDLPLFLSAKKRAHIAGTIADALAEIHKTTAGKYGYIGKTERFGTWREFYQNILTDTYTRFKIFCKQNENGLNGKITALPEAGIQNLGYILADEPENPCLVHGDLWIGNIMADKKTCEPSGILDPLNSMWGDGEFDLFPLNAPQRKNFKLYETYKEKFAASERVDLKTALYYLANEVLCRLQSGGWSRGGGNAFYRTLIKRLETQYKKHNIKFSN